MEERDLGGMVTGNSKGKTKPLRQTALASWRNRKSASLAGLGGGLGREGCEMRL